MRAARKFAPSAETGIKNGACTGSRPAAANQGIATGIGTSAQSIYNWEEGKARSRALRLRRCENCWPQLRAISFDFAGDVLDALAISCR